MKKKFSFGLSSGVSSILIIIVILALVCFAGLSLASSNADYRMCRKLADRTTDYYKAASESYIALRDASKKESSSENSFEYIGGINENQILSVKATLTPEKENRYEITEFMIKNINTPEIDNSLSLLLGN